LSEIQLDRIRDQMKEALQPMTVYSAQIMLTHFHLLHEMGLTETKAKCGVSEAWVRPLSRFPHVEIMLLMKMLTSMVTSQYGVYQLHSEDLEAIQADPSKLEREYQLFSRNAQSFPSTFALMSLTRQLLALQGISRRHATVSCPSTPSLPSSVDARAT
jgi:hypothetical protein